MSKILDSLSVNSRAHFWRNSQIGRPIKRPVLCKSRWCRPTCRVVAEIIAKTSKIFVTTATRVGSHAPSNLSQGSRRDVPLGMLVIFEVRTCSHFGAISIYSPKMLGSRGPGHAEVSKKNFFQDSCTVWDFPWEHAHQIWCSYFLPLRSYWHLTTFNLQIFMELRDPDHAPF